MGRDDDLCALCGHDDDGLYCDDPCDEEGSHCDGEEV